MIVFHFIFTEYLQWDKWNKTSMNIFIKFLQHWKNSRQTDGRTDRSHGMQPSHLIPYHFWFLLRQWIFNLNLTNLASEWMNDCVCVNGWSEVTWKMTWDCYAYSRAIFLLHSADIHHHQEEDGWMAIQSCKLWHYFGWVGDWLTTDPSSVPHLLTTYLCQQCM